jgi:hypothetical protein
MKKIQDYLKQSYENSVNKGWYERPTTSIERFALMLSEISEATEEVRSSKEDFYLVEGKPEGQAVELVDVLIRIFDYSGYRNVNFSKFLETQFFVSFNPIITIDDLMNEVSQLNNIRCYEELQDLKSDIEFHISVAISICDAAKSHMKKTEKEFLFLAETVVKIAYFFRKKGWDMTKVLDIKHEYNVNRPHKHGGKVC